MNPITPARSAAAIVLFMLGVSLLNVTAPSAQAVGWESKKKPKPTVLTNEQIPAALLALEDFETGWASFPLPASASSASATEGFCNGANSLARAQNAGLVGFGVTAFAKDPQNGPLIDESISSFPSDQAAKSFLSTTTDQVKACTTPFDTAPPAGASPGVTAQATVSALSFPKLGGDQVLALREGLTEQLNGQNLQTIAIDQVYLRKGNHVLNVAHLATSPDVNLLQSYVQKAYTKFGVELQKARREATKHSR